MILTAVLAGCGGTEEVEVPVPMFELPDGGCSVVADDCSGDQICIAGACESAFSRVYEITIASARFPRQKSNGAPWDEGGGVAAPDAFVRIWVDGQMLGETSVVEDSYEPVWNEYVEATLFAGSTVQFSLTDSDLLSDDDMYACEFDPIPAAALRARGLLCSAMDGFEFRATIIPRG